MIHAVEPFRHVFDVNDRTRVIFGPGCFKTLHEYPMPGKKALICLDKDPFAKELGYVDTLLDELTQADCEYVIYDGIQANPLLSQVNKGLEILKEQKCDFLVALGGGGPCDTAKAIALMATNPGSLWDYIQGGTGGCKVAQFPALPIIAIPTTASSGSEVAAGTVINNDVTGEKNSFKNVSMYPTYCFTDPELHLSVPPRLTAYMAYDAMSHCMEGYIMRKSTLFTDMYTIAAVENGYHYLPRAVENGKDLEAREHVAFIAVMTGWCMNTASTSTLQVLAQALNEFDHTMAHGWTVTVLSHAYHAHQIAIHSCDERYVQLARALGRPNATKPEEFLEAHAEFLKAIHCDDLKMSDYGVKPEHFPRFVASARASVGAYFTTQDRIPLSNEDCIKIFTESYK